jgi:hypothetical protein
MDVFVHSTLYMCAAAVGINIGGAGCGAEREGTIKIKRYGKWNGKFNSVQAQQLYACCVPLAFLCDSPRDLIFHQRHKTRRPRRSSWQEIKVPTTTSDD